MATETVNEASNPVGKLAGKLRRQADAASRFSAIFRHCIVHPTRVYRLRKQSDGNPPKIELHKHMKAWADAMLASAGCRYRTIGTPSPDAVMIVGNHISYLDIPLVMAATPTVFVAKKEISSWPVIGYACNSIDIVWVERGSGTSRRDAGAAIAPAILERGHKVALFPSGTTTVDENVPWKRGAFRIAYDNKIRVQPFRIRYTPLRRAAFIGKDLFVPHLWNLITQGGVDATLEWGETREITNVSKDCQELQRWTTEGLSAGGERTDR
jgi:1-acyl-sn-glycerol-3-phosphate acyltransferase